MTLETEKPRNGLPTVRGSNQKEHNYFSGSVQGGQGSSVGRAWT